MLHYCTEISKARTLYLEHGFGTKIGTIYSPGRAKAYIDPRTKKEMSQDRLVAPQPLLFENVYNLRKLMELPLHLVPIYEDSGAEGPRASQLGLADD